MAVDLSLDPSQFVAFQPCMEGECDAAGGVGLSSGCLFVSIIEAAVLVDGIEMERLNGSYKKCANQCAGGCNGGECDFGASLDNGKYTPRYNVDFVGEPTLGPPYRDIPVDCD
jgi:hypothetical protein